MSRVTLRGERYSMAYGVDRMPSIGAFVQVWDHNKYPEPDPDNMVEDHSCWTTGGRNLTEEFVINVARQYEIPIDEREVYKVFD